MRKKLARVTFVALLFATFAGAARSQTPHPGIVLFNQGNYEAAVTTLDRVSKEKDFKTNAEIFNYLGLSQIEIGDAKQARKSFDKASSLEPGNLTYRVNLAHAHLLNRQVDKAKSETAAVLRLDPNHVGAHYLHGIANIWEGKLDEADADADRAISIDPKHCDAYILKSDVQLARLGVRTAKGGDVGEHVGLLKSAVNTLETGLSTCATSGKTQRITSKYESAKAFHSYFARDKTAVGAGTTAGSSGAAIVPLKILGKPLPAYTDSARGSGTQGTITIAVLFGASGKIEGMLLLNRLGNGLDEHALSAARKIKFEPQQVGGKRVSVVKRITYTFAVY